MLQLADHEGLVRYFQLTHDTLMECCLREPKRCYFLDAASGTAVVGYATYMFQFSPWLRASICSSTIYVAEEARKSGVGRCLMRRVAQIALDRDVDVRWHVETNNLPAQKFYAGLGAELRDRFIAYWSRDAIRPLLD